MIRVRAGISYALIEAMDGAVIGDSVGETPCVFLTGLHRGERAIADRLVRLANSTLLPWPGSIRTRHCRGSRNESDLLLPKAN